MKNITFDKEIKKELSTSPTSTMESQSRVTTTGDNVSNSNENVKSNISNEYDMQELDNSSFSLSKNPTKIRK